MQKQYKSIYIQQKTPNSRVFYIYLNNPSKLNAFPYEFLTEFPDALSSLDKNPNVAVIVLCGAGDHFCAGADLKVIKNIAEKGLSTEKSRANEWLRREIKFIQESATAMEKCRKPVIASIHGYCVAGGVDIVTSCDIRFCTKDTVFSVQHVNVGFTADMGTLQRLPAIVGYGNAMELALTGRKFSGQEAKDMGLVSLVFESKEALDEGVRLVAEGIAAKSPTAVIGTKTVTLKSKDLTLEQGLDYVATWNAATVYSSGDLLEALTAKAQKRKPHFAKL
ncbi:delta(3,5)-Delta(2,4)-dienoyl-CoA isomerase, peroxisomal-like [Euphorbia lathyris]|uniref:delta(3,5)-Delta(2,4)-dienoyl-CoA isomerase, peroxisomal-like n=1 Tax=Euphorbia lathyris TaxID=212925 RepID=UPI00331382F1